MAKQVNKPAAKPVSKNATVNKAVATQAQTLPMDIFKASPQGGALVGGGSMSPYVQFWHDRAKNAQQAVQALGPLHQGDPFLVRGGNMTKLTPLTFIMTETYYQYFATVDMESKIIHSIIPTSPEDQAPQGYTEFIEAVIFTIVSSKDLVCSRIRLRGPKCKGFKQAKKELDKMRENEDWAKESKDNTLVSKVDLPDWAYLTFTATLTTTPPKGKGLPYEVMTTSVETSKLSVLDTMMKSFRDDEYVTACKAAQHELISRWDSEVVPKSK